MLLPPRRSWAVCAALLAALGLGGCASHPTSLYYWGDYQPQVYEYLVAADQKGPEAQLQVLEQTAAEAQSRGEALPPGFNAHRGLLYLKAGQADKAQAAFLAEETQYPESKPYMQFLLKKSGSVSTADSSGSSSVPQPAQPAAAAAEVTHEAR